MPEVREIKLKYDGPLVAAPTVIGTGSRVVRVFPSTGKCPTGKYHVGTVKESAGMVAHVRNSIEGDVLCTVYWDIGDETIERVGWLMALEDYINHLISIGITIPVTPKFKENQVLYVKPSPLISPSPHYPALNSDFESDVKVLSHTHNSLQTSVKYRVYVPKFGETFIAEDQLLTYSEKMEYKYRDYQHGTLAEDKLPFFKKDEAVKLFDGWVYNMDETVIIRLTNELKQAINIKEK